MSTHPSIAIVGAGPAGLTLALLLLKTLPPTNPITLKIYDLDASATSRAHQGGSLDLHPQTGLAALKKCGLWDDAAPHLRYEGEELVIADQNATEFVHMREAKEMDVGGEGKWAQRPEIDRERLKEILLKAVGGERVDWGRKLVRVVVGSEEGEEGKGRLEFEDGSVEGPFDLVVGADGAFSKVRHVLTDVRPVYSGICGVQGHIDRPNEEFPGVSKMVGRGSYFSYFKERALMAQRVGDESIRVGCWFRREKDWVEGVFEEKAGDVEAIRKVLLGEYEDWVEEMRDWLKACSSFRPWILFELPVGHTWEHRKGFTLIGDAAHLCTPFAGLGVNAAMKDALDLSEMIVKSVTGDGTSLDQAVEAYEKEMFPRAKKVQEHTMRNKVSMFDAAGPVKFMTVMVGVVGQELGWPIDKGILRWIPISKMTYVSFWLLGKFGALSRWVRESWRRKREQKG